MSRALGTAWLIDPDTGARYEVFVTTSDDPVPPAVSPPHAD